MRMWRFLGARQRYAAAAGMALVLSILVHLSAGHDSVGAAAPAPYAPVLAAWAAPAAQSVPLGGDASYAAPEYSHLAEHPSHPPRKPSQPQPTASASDTALFVPRPVDKPATPAPRVGPAASVTHGILRC
ncbi:hypothetical protein [Actinacidiphila oryziradicis]|uniref:Uncharacterized protein n=1 Tax=Actinacidiphila oryziradicis TaxID=2571141 RepID=A0A4U0RY41_9ACTN|nr:hypothetical protein [Actinacidiphila oryziradicis]TKA00593.1 hypothetical protein FCI23_42455 [Actinacidiphila oryziradicis]